MISQQPDSNLSTYNYLQWRKLHLENDLDLGQAAKDVENNKETILIAPTLSEKFLDMDGQPTEHFKYDQKDGKPTRDGIRDLRMDLKSYTDLLEQI